LKPHHQLNQLVLAQTLQISAVHWAMDSEIAVRGKGVARATRNSAAAPLFNPLKMGVGKYSRDATACN
jgi:hypothetical protein